MFVKARIVFEEQQKSLLVVQQEELA